MSRAARVAASVLTFSLALSHRAPAAPVAETEVALAAGTLTVTDINGGTSDDDLLLTYLAGVYTLTDSGGLIISTAIPGSTGSGSSTVTFPDTGVTGIVFDTLAGNDAVEVASTQAALAGGLVIDGGSGTLSLGVITTPSSADITSSDALTLTDNITSLAAGGLVTLTVTSGGVSQTGGTLALGDDALELLGSGSFTLNQSNNEVATLAANVAGTLSVRTHTNTTVGTAGGTTGIATGDNAVALAAGETGQDRTLTLETGAAITATSAIAGTQRVTLTADRMSLQGTIIADQGVVTLQQFENTGTGTNIDLGGVDSVGTLGLSDADVDDINAGRLQIGNGSTGLVTLVGAIGPGGANDLRVMTARSIVDNNGGIDIEVTSLTLETREGVGSSADLVDIDVDDLRVANSAAGSVAIRETDDLTAVDISNPGRSVILDVGGSIADGDMSTDITSADLGLFAANGIGTSPNPLQTSVDRLELANVASGDVFLTEVNALEIRDLVTPAVGPDFVGPGDGISGDIDTPGQIVVGGNLTLRDSFDFRITGSTPVSQFLQLAVTGEVDVTNAPLLVPSGGFSAVGNETFTLIENDAADAVTGTFLAQPEASTVAVGGKTFLLSYMGGDGNDVVLGPPDTEVTLAGGVLTITDINGGDSNDDLVIAYAGGTYTLSDTGGLIITSSIPGSTGNITSTVTFPDTGVTRIVFDTLGGNDTLTVNSAQIGLPGGFAVVGGPGSDSVAVNGSLDTAGGAIDIAVESFTTSSVVAADVGNILVTADGVALGAAITGSGSLTLQPQTSSATLGLGGGAGALNLDDTELAFLTDGFSSITVGAVGLGTGEVQIDTATFTDPITIAGGTIHDGAGTDIDAGTDAVTLIGNVAPGQSPGILMVTGALGFGASEIFEAEIQGATPGTQHDQIAVVGSVDLTGATLNLVDTGFSAVGDEVIVLVANDGADAVFGTFTGLPEGTQLVVGGQTFAISYVGGDGNDVVLSEPPPSIPTLSGLGTSLLILLLGWLCVARLRQP